MAVLVTKWFGVFLVEGGRVVAEKRFPAQAREVADRLIRLRRGEILEEERGLSREGLEVLDARLKPLGRVADKNPFFDLPVEEPEARLLHEASLLVARDESRQAAGEKDRFVAHAVRAVDDVNVALNTLVERVREWYGLHYPEALAGFTDPRKLIASLAKDPHREAVAGAGARDSIGVEFSPEGLGTLQGFAAGLETMYKERERLERLLEREMPSVAPALSRVAGPLVAARLVSQAGSLERLAGMPASTLQTLGAETALFAHLKEGTKPPKHGVIFQHGLVNTAPYWQRGRMARILAAGASLAARLDYFGNRDPAAVEAILARIDAQSKRVKQEAKSPRPAADARKGPPQKFLARKGPPAKFAGRARGGPERSGRGDRR